MHIVQRPFLYSAAAAAAAMTACDATSLTFTSLALVYSFAIWWYLKPKLDNIYKFIIKIIFAAYFWNHVYVAWIAPVFAERLSLYSYFPRYEAPFMLVPVLFTWVVLDS